MSRVDFQLTGGYDDQKMEKTPNERARDWLVRHDPSSHREGVTAYTYWGGQPDDTDFVAAVLDNLVSFGLDKEAVEAVSIVRDAWCEPAESPHARAHRIANETCVCGCPRGRHLDAMAGPCERPVCPEEGRCAAFRLRGAT